MVKSGINKLKDEFFVLTFTYKVHLKRLKFDMDFIKKENVIIIPYDTQIHLTGLNKDEKLVRVNLDKENIIDPQLINFLKRFIKEKKLEIEEKLQDDDAIIDIIKTKKDFMDHLKSICLDTNTISSEMLRSIIIFRKKEITDLNLSDEEVIKKYIPIQLSKVKFQEKGTILFKENKIPVIIRVIIDYTFNKDELIEFYSYLTRDLETQIKHLQL